MQSHDYICTMHTKLNKVITTKYIMYSRAETTTIRIVYIFKCTLQCATAKFAHMNGDWKTYDT